MLVRHRTGLTIHAVDTCWPDASICGKRLLGGSRLPDLVPVTCDGCKRALLRPRFAFCETVVAGSQSPIHIRVLSNAGLKTSGGADTLSLCGRSVAWDLTGFVTEETSGGDPRTCRTCNTLWLESRRLA